ncbi:heat shock protein 90-6, mitochondrial-like [Iris pallida]|uniref:Heat shock protein 90-6, mitochondrial-like n=1 Tax=Iris pallida TaxID=29817 RepID=A0AAX6GYM2_IRIPA|nr:heat shock protein 90-6, mitochondrial-like [Iris pallida]
MERVVKRGVLHQRKLDGPKNANRVRTTTAPVIRQHITNANLLSSLADGFLYCLHQTLSLWTCNTIKAKEQHFC